MLKRVPVRAIRAILIATVSAYFSLGEVLSVELSAQQPRTNLPEVHESLPRSRKITIRLPNEARTADKIQPVDNPLSPPCGTWAASGRSVMFEDVAGQCRQEKIVVTYEAILDGNNERDRAVGRITLYLIEASPGGGPPPPPPVGGGSASNDPPASVKAALKDCGTLSLFGSSFHHVPRGSFNLQDAPVGIDDFSRLLNNKSFSVEEFCILTVPVGRQAYDDFLQATKVTEQKAIQGQNLCRPLGGPPAAGMSHDDATAFATFATQKFAPTGRSFRLPRVDEYVAAAIYLRSNDPKSSLEYLQSVRFCQQEWTTDSCHAPDRYFAVGQDRKQELRRFCFFSQDRNTAYGFRLVLQ